MKYVLVDKIDNIVDRVELGSEVGISGARTFFIGRKKIDEKEFDNMWKVMTERQYNNQFTASLQNKQYEWWKELTKEQQKELKWLSAEIEAEAIRMRIDYEENPSEESGSIVVVHQESEFLKEIEEEE